MADLPASALTPLPGDPPRPPDAAAALPGLMADLSTNSQAVAAAATEAATAAKQQIAQSYLDVVGAASANIQGAKNNLSAVWVPVAKALSKVVGGVKSTLTDGEVAVWQQGVKTPLSLMDRITDLEDQTDSGFTARIAPALATAPGSPGEPVAIPDPIAVPPVSIAPPVLVPPVSIAPPVLVPPVPPVTIGAPPAGVRCDPPYQWVFNQQAAVWVCTLPGVYAPLPPVPPVVPPPVVPPVPPTGGGNCAPTPSPAQLVSCYTPPPIQLPILWWVTVDCSDRCNPKVCVWSGTGPPVGYTGILAGGPYSTQPTDSQVQGLLSQCSPTSPPVVAPVAPPVAPPSLPAPPSVPPIVAPVVPPPSPGGGVPPINVPISGAPPSDEIPPNEITSAEWSDPSICTSLHSQIIAGLQAGKVPTITDQEPGQEGNWYNLGVDLAWGTSPIAALVGGLPPAPLSSLINDLKGAAGDLWKEGVGTIASILDASTWNSVPNSKAASSLMVQLGVANRIETLTGMPISYLMESTRLLYQYANPQYIPTQSGLDRMYLADRINRDTWTCYTKASGNIPELAHLQVLSDQRRPGVNEIVSLWRRGAISSYQSMSERLRREGVLEKQSIADYVTLSEQLPTQSDLIRFMVRDVFDAGVVAKYQLDTGFFDKWTADSKKFGTAIGVSDDQMKLQWRAHWHVPSDTSLYSFVWRLRPDRQEVKDWDANPAPVQPDGSKLGIGLRPPTFDETDLAYALTINDNIPSLIQNLVAIHYRPITNTDAIRMYSTGFISDQQLIERYRDNGYSLDNATTLARFHRADRAKLISNRSGVWTVRQAVAAAKLGTIAQVQFIDIVTPLLIDEKLVNKLWADILTSLAAESKKVCLLGLKKRYLYGEFDANQLMLALNDLSIAGNIIPTLIKNWACERASRRKEPRVTMVLDWYKSGIINVDGLKTRLTNLGYMDDDIANMINSIGHNLQAAAAAAATKQAVAAAKALRDEQRAVQRQNIALAKEARAEMEEPIKIEKMKAAADASAKKAGQPEPYPL